MLLSLNWLADHLDLDGLAPSTLAHELTMRTALIEGLTDQRRALEGVVVGEVLACEAHPDADRLSLCQVAWGQSAPAAVVCGAPNVAVGQKIAYAPVGLTLPSGLKLKKARIRGRDSEGMICAEDELGLGPEHDGILVLEAALDPGQPVGELAGLADVVLEIDNKSVTHRPDLWGHRGFARELAAIFDRELRPLELDTNLRPGDAGPAIELESGAGCPLYAGLCVDDSPSRAPDWLRFRLVACGMRPLGLLVDLSNYVMLELGQPTHPFDRERLAGDRIAVRRARAGERLTTLDEVERLLTPEDTVIADGERAVALAGIMGSARAEVGEGTGRVFLESASFDAHGVRRSASRLGLRTEALARFEKGLDPGLVEVAIRRYAALLGRLRPEAVVAPVFRMAGSGAVPESRVVLEGALVRARLGLAVEDTEIVRVLTALSFGVTSLGAGRFDVAVPPWRATRDVSLPEDLVEEVGRVLGYDRIVARAPVGRLLLSAPDPLLKVEEQLRDILARETRATETLAHSTVRDRTLALVGWPSEERRPRLTNALQQDAARLRPSVVPEMLARLEPWLRHAPSVRTFEVGRGYAEGGDGTVHETREVALLVARREARDARDVVRELRGVAEAALQALARPGGAPRVWTPGAREPWFHLRRSAELWVSDVAVARLGAVAPDVLVRAGVEGSAGLLVFDVEALAATPARVSAYRPVPRHPAARIDLAVVAGYALGTEQLMDAMRKAGPRTLRSVEPFDVYRGALLDPDERSIAFHLVFQASDRTLNDKDVQKARDRIVRAVEELGARLR